nr:hypothetical protein CFP56_38278 [Quercus suber]
MPNCLSETWECERLGSTAAAEQSLKQKYRPEIGTPQIFSDAGQYVIRFGSSDPGSKTGPATIVEYHQETKKELFSFNDFIHFSNLICAVFGGR